MRTRTTLAALAEPRLLAWAALWTVVSGLAFGVVAAIVPNPVFGRQIPPEPFAIVTWILSAPLMGLILATYTVPASPASDGPIPLGTAATAATAATAEDTERRSSRLAGVASFGAFLAIGCPVCNKAALLLLGTSGALTIWAPLQPALAVASLLLLAGTAAWRLRTWADGACAIPAPTPTDGAGA